MEEKIKHLEFIQNIINRMAKNSFLLKGWVMTLVVAIISLGEKDIFNLLYFVIFIFYLLDSYFLYQEKIYIQLYNQVRMNKVGDFILKTKKSKQEFCRAIISLPNLILYISLLLLVLAIN